MVQLGGFLGSLDRIMGSALGLVFEVLKSMDIAKNIKKSLLDAGYNFIDDKTNMKPSSLLKS